MPKVILLGLVVVLCASPLIASDTRYGIGGGFVDNEADVDNAPSDVEGDGIYGVFNGVGQNGLLILVSLSFTDAEDTEVVDLGMGPVSVTINDEQTRLGASVGYLFRKDNMVRPFLHGGIGWVQVEEDILGIQTIDDSSIGLSVGVGLEAGKGHHAFYSNLVFDFGHEVAIEILGTSFGDSEFDLRELHLGYLYTF